MSVQTNYNYTPNAGAPGGIVDLAPYAIDAFANTEETGVLKLGMGVVAGEGANGLALPNGDSAGADFLGITVNGRTNEIGLDGETYIRKKATVGVMRYGRIYARVKSNITVAAGEAVYLIKSGDDAGLFTNVSTDNVAVKAKFLGPVGANGVAPVHLFDTPHA